MKYLTVIERLRAASRSRKLTKAQKELLTDAYTELEHWQRRWDGIKWCRSGCKSEQNSESNWGSYGGFL